ncbi:hypothetical protein ACFQ0B_51400 [Nonomuraea thailandensis]
MTFHVKADAAGSHRLVFRYSTTVAATRTIYVDGVAAGTLAARPARLGHLGHGHADHLAHRGRPHRQDRVRRLEHRWDQPRQPGGGPAMKRSLVLLTALFLPLLVAPPAQAAVQRVQFTSGSTYLIVELLDDDLVHFELASGTSPGTGSPLFTTPQVARTDYPGPSGFSQSGNTLTTAAMKVEVTTGTLCVKVSDPARLLYEACPRNLTQAWKGLTITKGSMQHAYGLGEQFFTGGSADGDWVGRTRSPGGPYGNAMVFDGDNGPVGNAQIPVLFAVGAANLNYGLLLDQVYKQEWNLTADPWTVDTWGDQLRWYTMTGPDLPDLRRDYMELTGRRRCRRRRRSGCGCRSSATTTGPRSTTGSPGCARRRSRWTASCSTCRGSAG